MAFLLDGIGKGLHIRTILRMECGEPVIVRLPAGTRIRCAGVDFWVVRNTQTNLDAHTIQNDLWLKRRKAPKVIVGGIELDVIGFEDLSSPD